MYAESLLTAGKTSPAMTLMASCFITCLHTDTLSANIYVSYSQETNRNQMKIKLHYTNNKRG